MSCVVGTWHQRATVHLEIASVQRRPLWLSPPPGPFEGSLLKLPVHRRQAKKAPMWFWQQNGVLPRKTLSWLKDPIEWFEVSREPTGEGNGPSLLTSFQASTWTLKLPIQKAEFTSHHFGLQRQCNNFKLDI